MGGKNHSLPLATCKTSNLNGHLVSEDSGRLDSVLLYLDQLSLMSPSCVESASSREHDVLAAYCGLNTDDQ